MMARRAMNRAMQTAWKVGGYGKGKELDVVTQAAKRYTLGRNRMLMGGGAAAGLMVLNASRAPSSATQGLTPNSIGGTTGGY